MCDVCVEAARAADMGRLEEVAADSVTNCYLTRCPSCRTLWETYAHHPHFSWELSPSDARRKYPNGSI